MSLFIIQINFLDEYIHKARINFGLTFQKFHDLDCRYKYMKEKGY